MSIIYEALKKTQNGPRNESNPLSNLTGATRTAKSTPKMKIALSLIGTLVGILLSWLMINKLIVQSTKQALPSAGFNSPAAAPRLIGMPGAPLSAEVERSQSAREKLSAQEPPELILNGIVLSPDGDLVLINEEILKVGDEIRGAKLEEITDKLVTLTFQNQKIILKKN